MAWPGGGTDIDHGISQGVERGVVDCSRHYSKVGSSNETGLYKVAHYDEGRKEDQGDLYSRFQKTEPRTTSPHQNLLSMCMVK